MKTQKTKLNYSSSQNDNARCTLIFNVLRAFVVWCVPRYRYNTRMGRLFRYSGILYTNNKII